MGGLGFLFAVVLAIADSKLRVEENPKIEKIYAILPNTNCGACGYAGCFDYAVNIVNGTAGIDSCPVGGQDVVDEIARILGIESKESVKLIARILCKGGNAEAPKKPGVNYYGPGSCSVQAIVGGGEKMCLYGCLRGGDCVQACPFGAIFMNKNGLPEIIEELCTGCGKCAEACPRGVIEIHPTNRNLFIFCKNHDKPKRSKEVCKVACTGCGICARKSGGGIEMRDFLPVINYDLLDVSKIPIDKCKPGVIRLIHPEREMQEKLQE